MAYKYTDLRKEAVKITLDSLEGDYDKKLTKHLHKGIGEFINVLTKHIDNGDEVSIKGLGVFYRTKVNRTKKFISPLDGKNYGISKTHRIGFRASKTFK